MIRSITIFFGREWFVSYALEPRPGTYDEAMAGAEVEGDTAAVLLPGSPLVRRTYKGLPYFIEEVA